MTIIIQPVTTIAECRQIEALQKAIWQTEDIDIVPDHLILTLAKEGGMVLLIKDEADAPIGFTLGFLSITHSGQLKLASHLAGVLPTYQSQNVGYQLKLAQRELAIVRQIDLITWTYDPLKARNARFNLHKLGAVCQTYHHNLYGAMRDSLNKNLPSDRFRVDWWITSDHVRQRLAGQVAEPPVNCPILNPITQFVNDLPLPPEQILPMVGSVFMLEMPADIDQLKSLAPDLAQQWQLHLGQLWSEAFQMGYTAIDVIRQSGRIYYLLQSHWQPAKMEATT